MSSGGALLSAIVLCIVPVLEAYTCDEIFSKATTLDFSHSGAEINVICRLNLKHIEPHVLAPYLDILRTTSLVACFYSVYDVRHHDEYFNQESHVIAICKPGAMCLNRLHNEAYERGCVDGHTNQAACGGDFCNSRTLTEMDLVNNILSTLTKTTPLSGSTTSTFPMTTTPVRQLYTDSMTCEDIFRKASVLDFSQSDAEIKEACRLNLQHIEPHILAPYLDILRTTSLVACFYSVYDVRHHDEYFNQESHVIAICKPGAMCFNEGHSDAYKRGCVAGNTNQHQSTCSTDFCNNRTQTEMDMIGNILSLITTTTIKTTTTSTTTPSTTTTSTPSTTTPSPTTTSTTTPSTTTTSTPSTTPTTTPSPTTTSTTTPSTTTTSTPSTTPTTTPSPTTTSTTTPSPTTTSTPSTTSIPSTTSTTLPSTTTTSPTTSPSTSTSVTKPTTTIKPSTTSSPTTTSTSTTSPTTSVPINSPTVSSTSLKTTTSKPIATTSKPMTTTPNPMTTTKPAVTTTAISSINCSNSPQHQCRSEGFCSLYNANTGACNKPIDDNSKDFFDKCALFCNRCQEYCQLFAVNTQPTAAPGTVTSVETWPPPTLAPPCRFTPHPQPPVPRVWTFA